MKRWIWLLALPYVVNQSTSISFSGNLWDWNEKSYLQISTDSVGTVILNHKRDCVDLTKGVLMIVISEGAYTIKTLCVDEPEK